MLLEDYLLKSSLQPILIAYTMSHLSSFLRNGIFAELMDNPVTSDIYHQKNELKDNRITDMLSDHTHYEK